MDQQISDAELGRAGITLTYGLLVTLLREGLITRAIAVEIVNAAKATLVSFPASEPRGDIAALDEILRGLSGNQPVPPAWSPTVVPGGKP